MSPGDRGSAVFEVQRRMKQKCYYPCYLDGVYGEGMKRYVLKFRDDNKLKNTHDIDRAFYKKLNIELID